MTFIPFTEDIHTLIWEPPYKWSIYHFTVTHKHSHNTMKWVQSKIRSVEVTTGAHVKHMTVTFNIEHYITAIGHGMHTQTYSHTLKVHTHPKYSINFGLVGLKTISLV